MFHQIHSAQLAGDSDAVQTAARQYHATSLKAGAPANAILVQSSALVFAGVMRGDLTAVVPLVHQAITENPAYPPLPPLLAWALALGADPAEARRTLEADRARGLSMPYNESWHGHVHWVEAAYRAGDRNIGPLVLADLEPWLDRAGFCQGVYAFSIAHYAGLCRYAMGDLDAAIVHLRRAVTNHERIRAPFHTAWSQVVLARFLVEHGDDADVDAAHVLLDAADVVGRKNSYGFVVRDVAAARATLPN